MPSQFISEEERTAVEAEEIRAFFNETNDQNLAGALVMSMLVYVVHEGIPTWTWQPALFGLYAVTLVRAWLVWQFHHAPSSRSTANWERTQTISGGLSGVCWGVANTAMLTQLSTEFQLVILTVITVAAATNASEGFAYPPPSRAYILASLCPPTIWLLTVGDRLHFILALMLMLFVPMTLWQGKKRNLIFIEAQQLRFRNESLAIELTRQRDAAEQSSRALSLSATELKSAESNTDRERIRLQMILKMASDGIHILDNEGLLVEANEAFLDMLGYDPSVIGKLRITDWSESSWADSKARLDDLTSHRARMIFETRHRRRDGSFIDVEISASGIEIDGKGYLYATSRDITERKQAEAQLQASEKRLQLVLEATKDGIWDWDIQRNTVYMSPRHHEMTGYRPDEFSGTLSDSVMKAVHPDDRAIVMSTMNAHLQSSERATSLDFRLLDRSGKIRWVVSRGRVVERDADGTPIRMVGALTDISRRKRIELDLLASKASTKALLDNTPYMMWMKDEDGRYLYVNETFVDSVGKINAEEIIGGTDFDIYSQERAVRYQAGDTDVMASRQQMLIEEPDFANGQHYWMETFKKPVVASDGRLLGTVGFSRDITARKERERKHQEREVEYRNVLVREVHHRIKNNLQSVAALLRRTMGKHPDLDHALDAAIGQVKAIAVVHGLQSVDGDDSIRLADTLRMICTAAQGQLNCRLDVQMGEETSGYNAIRIVRDEAVAIALILNELVLNAVKHSPENVPTIEVKLRVDGFRAHISIRNAKKGGRSFDIETGAGLNTGLRLIRSLMPEEGATLSYDTEREAFMVTQLVLTAPVVELIEQRGAF